MAHRVVDYVLANAEDRQAESPRTFFIPPRSERDNLQPGDVVKLMFELVDAQDGDPAAERMWVQVDGREGATYVGVLTNTPGAITTISLGDRVEFGPEHVLTTLEDWPLLEKKIFVSRRSHEQDVRPGYVYREDPDNERDSGWRALVGDESQDEVDDPNNVLLQNLGFLVDRWPELRPVLETDPAHGAWAWDEAVRAFRPAPRFRAGVTTPARVLSTRASGPILPRGVMGDPGRGARRRGEDARPRRRARIAVGQIAVGRIAVGRPAVGRPAVPEMVPSARADQEWGCRGEGSWSYCSPSPWACSRCSRSS